MERAPDIKRKIPLTRPIMGEEEERAVAEVLRSGHLTSGPKVSEFERVVAEYTGAKYAVATSSCTTALHLALLALGIGKGDEVAVPSFTFPATANAVTHAGARPRFADSWPNIHGVCCMHEHLMPAPLFGRSSIWPSCAPVRHPDKSIIIDAACGMGAIRHEEPADVTCYSFHPRKIITTGEGGMLVTNDGQISRKARQFRDHGKCFHYMDEFIDGHCEEHYRYEPGGFNYRMTDIQAAIGIEQMKRLDYCIKGRRNGAAAYRSWLSTVEELTLPNAPGHTYQSYVCVYSGDRDKLIADLAERGIETCLGTFACHRIWGLDDKDFPESSRLADQTISLPLWPTILVEELDYVCKMVKECI